MMVIVLEDWICALLLCVFSSCLYIYTDTFVLRSSEGIPMKQKRDTFSDASTQLFSSDLTNVNSHVDLRNGRQNVLIYFFFCK